MGKTHDQRREQSLSGPTTMPQSMSEAPSVDSQHDPMMELALAGGGGNAAALEAMSAQSGQSKPGCNDIDADGSIQMLIGGPYTDELGGEHTYGHAAARVMSGDGETDSVYDFGRYGDTRGEYSAEGEGILQEWDHSFDGYMDTQNKLGRETDGYSFPATECQIQEAVAMMEARKEGAVLEETLPLPVSGPDSEMREYILEDDYHALNNNCTTLSADVLEQGRPDIELDDPKEQQGRGMRTHEYLASKAVEGWPEDIFMPADMNEVLKNVSGDDVMVENWKPGESGIEHTVSQNPYRTCPVPGRRGPSAQTARASQ